MNPTGGKSKLAHFTSSLFESQRVSARERIFFLMSALLIYINRRGGGWGGGLVKQRGLSRAHGPLSPGLTQGEHLEAAVFWPR